MKLFIGFVIIVTSIDAVLSFSSVKAVIFDMDGLLLDSEEVYFKAHSDVCKMFNKTYTKEVKMKVMGTQPNLSAKTIVDTLNINITPEAYRAEYEKLISQRLISIDFMPGAQKVVRHLSSYRIPIALATSNTAPFYELATMHHKPVFNLFEHIVIGGSEPEVKNGKPAPDIFLICAKRFKDPPKAEKVLVFEDAPQGVLAARRAGMQVVMVPDPTLPEQYQVNATKVIPTLEDFIPEEFGLPPY